MKIYASHICLEPAISATSAIAFYPFGTVLLISHRMIGAYRSFLAVLSTSIGSRGVVRPKKCPPRPPPEGGGGQPHQRCISICISTHNRRTDSEWRSGLANRHQVPGTTPPHLVKLSSRTPALLITIPSIGRVSRALPRENST